MTCFAHAFSATFTTTVMERQQLTVVCSLRLHAGSEGSTFISATASHSQSTFLTQPRTDPDLRNYLIRLLPQVVTGRRREGYG